ncbi:MAG: DUF547 domain-containing protein [Nitrospirota bacterium]
MSRIFADYVEKAKRILDENWTGSSTKPSPKLYPHQWNWDSGFIAIGTAHFDPARAMKEMETLFAAQWKNGMLPQIVFDPDRLGHYFPEPDFWQSERSPNAPEGALTSGITMPPIHAVAVEKIYEILGGKREFIGFLERIYPKLLALHDYLYRERDPGGEGLVYIRHPWESGIDNSPTWDGPLKRIAIDKEKLPPYERKDLNYVDPAMRPSDEDYDRYVYLVDLFRRNDYDEDKIRGECPFLIQDPLFNSVLCRANESLAKLAEMAGETPERPQKWYENTARAIQGKLWHGEHEIFDAYDLADGSLIEVDTAAGFLPLFAGAASRGQAEKLYERLNSKSFCALHQGNCFTVPNYDTQKKGFDPSNYWRGPVWININWMLAHGLRRYDYILKADSLQKDLLQLPIRFGFHEYFDSFDGTGYGSDDFSWTAALFIDLVDDFYEAERKSLGRKLADFARGVAAGEHILNGGDEMPDVATEELGERLMGSIQALRDEFYDTKRGRVDYEALRDSEEYRSYRALANGLREFDPLSLVGRREKISLWVNLYNTIVVDAIASLRMSRSVKEVPEFFSKVKYVIGPYRFSPDDMEHGILRANSRPWFHPFRQFGPADPRLPLSISPVDPRVHFALVCGSRSCAPINYYEPERIDEQLEEAARSFVNSSEVLVLPEDGKILISEIFRWYEKDFGGRKGIIDFIYDFLADDSAREFINSRAVDLEIEYLHYDWNLNR